METSVRLRPAARLAAVLALPLALAVALALGWQAPSALAAPRVAAGGGNGPSSPSTQATVINTQWLNLRSGPGLNCPVLTTISGGGLVAVISGPTRADGYDWYQVSYKGLTGYAAGAYLSGLTGNGGNTGGGGELTVGGYASVTAPYLNLRCGPSLSCPISMSLPQGAIVKLLGGPTAKDGYHWWQVSYTNQTGYVAGDYLTPASGPGGGPQGCTSTCTLVVGGDAQVTSAALNLRTGPSITCPVATSMPHAAVVHVLDGPTQEDGYDWYKVSYGGTVGYAAGAYLAPVSGTGGSGGSPHPGADAVVTGTPYLHLRNGAGLACDILATMPQGATVHVLDGPTSADGFDWYKVSYNGQTGYAAGAWLAPA